MSITSPPDSQMLAPMPARQPAPPRGWEETAPGGPGMPGMPGAAMAAGGIDYLGIAWRRKWIIALFAIVGAAIGYLIYTKTPVIYQSSMRLLITEQSPPMIVNGDVLPRQTSIGNHQNLLTSNLVISNAVKNGDIEKLNTFRDAVSPVGYLAENLEAEPEKTADDIISLSLIGPDAEELPIILGQILHAYKGVIAQDSADIGHEAVAVMESRQETLQAEIASAEERYFDLVKKLGLTQFNDADHIINPYSETIADLKLRIQDNEQELSDVSTQIEIVKEWHAKPLKSEETTKLLAVQGRRYLQLPEWHGDRSRLRTEDAVKLLPLDMRRTYERMVKQVEDITSSISERELEKSRIEKRYGINHVQMRAIANDLATLNSQLEDAKDELEKIEGEAADSKNQESSDRVISLDELSQRGDLETVRVYALALGHDRDKLQQDLTRDRESLAEAETSAASISADLIQLNILKSQIDEKRQAIRDILDRLAEMNVLAGNFTYTKVREIDPAGIGYPVAPNLIKNLGIGVVLASMLGFGLAFLIDWSDQAYRNPQELAASIRAPVLGRIPLIRDVKSKEGRAGSLVTFHRSNSVAAESFRTVRTSVVFSGGKSGSKVFMVTSPSPGDGKSTMCANLAVSLAQMGRRVALVDADHRRPRAHQFFGYDMEPGSFGYLSGKCSWEDAVRHAEGIDTLSVITTGGYPKNPGELTSSSEFAEMIFKLRRDYDYVLVDTPPVLPVADALGMAAIVDEVILVLRIRRGVIVAAQKAREQLDMVNANVLGVIVNGLDNNPYYSDYGRYGYRYGYGYGYGSNASYGRYHESQKERYHDRVEKV